MWEGKEGAGASSYIYRLLLPHGAIISAGYLE